MKRNTVILLAIGVMLLAGCNVTTNVVVVGDDNWGTEIEFTADTSDGGTGINLPELVPQPPDINVTRPAPANMRSRPTRPTPMRVPPPPPPALEPEAPAKARSPTTQPAPVRAPPLLPDAGPEVLSKARIPTEPRRPAGA